MIARAVALALGLALTASPASESESSKPAESPDPPAPALVGPPPPQPVHVDPGNYRMVLAGNIVIGLGGAGLITMIAGLGIRSDAVTQRSALGSSSNPDPAAIDHQDQRISTGVALAITGGVSAAVLFGSGITLVAVGYARERKRRASLAWLPSPIIRRDQLGLDWTVRF